MDKKIRFIERMAGSEFYLLNSSFRQACSNRYIDYLKTDLAQVTWETFSIDNISLAIIQRMLITSYRVWQKYQQQQQLCFTNMY